MRRYHLIELHEQAWYPAVWRRLFQESLGQSTTLLKTYRGVAEPFARLLRRTGGRAVIDLCSGSAGPLIQLREWLPLPEEDKPEIVLSDLYPDVERFERARSNHPKAISYHPEPVDARSVPPSAPRIRTIFGALHHFQPHEVRAILRDAAENADGFAAFEPLERDWLTIARLLPTPLFASLLSFAQRPYTLKHLLWEAVIPVVPWTLLVDGVVSALRSYTPDELRAFTREVRAPDFEWEVGQGDIPGLPGARTTYLFGWRVRPPRAAA